MHRYHPAKDNLAVHSYYMWFGFLFKLLLNVEKDGDLLMLDHVFLRVIKLTQRVSNVGLKGGSGAT